MLIHAAGGKFTCLGVLLGGWVVEQQPPQRCGAGRLFVDDVAGGGARRGHDRTQRQQCNGLSNGCRVPCVDMVPTRTTTMTTYHGPTRPAECVATSIATQHMQPLRRWWLRCTIAVRWPCRGLHHREGGRWVWRRRVQWRLLPHLGAWCVPLVHCQHIDCAGCAAAGGWRYVAAGAGSAIA